MGGVEGSGPRGKCRVSLATDGLWRELGLSFVMSRRKLHLFPSLYQWRMFYSVTDVLTVNCLTVVAFVDDSLFGLLVREQLAVRAYSHGSISRSLVHVSMFSVPPAGAEHDFTVNFLTNKGIIVCQIIRTPYLFNSFEVSACGANYLHIAKVH